MRTPAPLTSSTASSNEFGVDDLFFSTTDRKGVIRSCNRIFERVSGYFDSELIGKAHNLVRHPDMPRAVFQELWDAILADRPIAAYVKNLRKDGTSYWVLAAVVPVGDAYLSVRLKPTSPLLPTTIEPLYAELRALELRIEGGEGRARKRAVEASQELLASRLAEAGFAGHDDFMRVALPLELSARDAAIGRLPGEPRDGDQDLLAILARVGRTKRWLDSLFTNVADYQALNSGLGERSAYVSDLAGAIGLFSLNALIKATRLGEHGRALGAVADIMGQRSQKIHAGIDALTAEVADAVGLLRRVSFETALCKLQTEMAALFASELLEHEEPDARRETRLRNDIALLARHVADEVESLADAVTRLEGHLRRIRQGVGQLAADLAVLRALQMNGKIEAAQIPDAGDVEALFAQIRGQLDDAAEKTAEFVTMTGRSGTSGRKVAVPRDLDHDLAELRVFSDVVASGRATRVG